MWSINRNKQITDYQKEVLFVELFSLLSSGLSFSKSFELLIKNESNQYLKILLQEIFRSIIAGSSLWQSMARTKAFTNLDCGIIRIGEETGKLSNTFLFLSDYYKKKIIQKRIIVGAISYPSIVLSLALVVMAFMLGVIVPMFEEVYSRMGGELPILTQVIINLSKQFDLITIFLLLILFIAIFIYYYFRKNAKFQSIIATIFLKAPLIGPIIKKEHEGQISKLLYLIYNSGVPLINGLQLVENIISFFPYKESISQIEKKIKAGALLSESLEEYPDLYSTKFITLIRVGEETNKLTEIMLRQSDEITKELEHKTKQLGTLLEPILIIFVGSIVALILISMYLPMFKLGGTFN